MRKAKQWNAMISRLMVKIEGKMENPAMFWTAYKMTTVPESNDLGSWFGWSISMLYDAQSGGIIQNLDNGKNIYLEARKFRKDVAEGNVNVAPESVSNDDVM